MQDVNAKRVALPPSVKLTPSETAIFAVLHDWRDGAALDAALHAPSPKTPQARSVLLRRLISKLDSHGFVLERRLVGVPGADKRFMASEWRIVRPLLARAL